MTRVYAFLIDGFEPSEAIVPIDFMRRAKFEVVVVSLMGRKTVNGSQGITVEADTLFEDVDSLPLPTSFSCLVDNTRNYLKYDKLKRGGCDPLHTGAWLPFARHLWCLAIMEYWKEKGNIYPGFESELEGITLFISLLWYLDSLLQGAGAGAAIYFGFKLVEVLADHRVAELIRQSVNYQQEV